MKPNRHQRRAVKHAKREQRELAAFQKRSAEIDAEIAAIEKLLQHERFKPKADA